MTTKLVSCAQSTLDVGGLTSTGSYSFDSGGKYSQSTTLGGSFKLKVPKACLTGTTCGFLETLLEFTGGFGSQNSIDSVSCEGSGDCTCTFVMKPDVQSETGTYKTAGTAVSTTPTAANASLSRDYCVEGDLLHFVSVDRTMTMGAMGQLKVTLDMVAKRK